MLWRYLVKLNQFNKHYDAVTPAMSFMKTALSSLIVVAQWLIGHKEFQRHLISVHLNRETVNLVCIVLVNIELEWSHCYYKSEIHSILGFASEKTKL